MGIFERDKEEVARLLVSNEMRQDVEDFTTDLARQLPNVGNYAAKVDVSNKRWRGYIVSTLPNAVNYEAKYGELSAILKKRNI
jgi:hypothetical protein